MIPVQAHEPVLDGGNESRGACFPVQFANSCELGRKSQKKLSFTLENFISTKVLCLKAPTFCNEKNK
jgi:hypothetical protein